MVGGARACGVCASRRHFFAGLSAFDFFGSPLLSLLVESLLVESPLLSLFESLFCESPFVSPPPASSFLLLFGGADE